MESACKVLIAARAKGAGMRWSRAGLQALASLRAVQRSGRWDSFWQTQCAGRKAHLFQQWESGHVGRLERQPIDALDHLYTPS